MAMPELLINDYPLSKIEEQVGEGRFSKEDLERHGNRFVTAGITLKNYVENHLVFEKWKWDEEGNLIVNLKNAANIPLDDEEQKALLERMRKTGINSKDLIRRFIREGLGLIEEDT